MKYLQTFAIILLTQLFLLPQGWSQRVMSLQECVDLAYARSLQLENSDLDMEQTAINATQARHARYPSLNGSTSYGWNFGKTIDPTTNAFDNQSSNYQTFSLSSSVSLYQGGALKNSIKQSELGGWSAIKRKEALMDNIGLQVAQNYLNALLAEEAQSLATYQVDLTQNQLERIDKLIAAGSLPANDRLELEAQLFRDEQQIIGAENNYILAILNLKNLLRLNPDETLTLEKVDLSRVPIDESVLDMSFNEVYSVALGYQPSIKADSIDLQIAEIDKKIQEGRLRPSLGVGGSISTNYSDLSKDVVGTEDVVTQVPIIINGLETEVGFPGTQPILDNTPYFDQLDNNLGYGFGVTLSFPIYNNYSARLNVERSGINIQKVQVQNEINKQNLQSTIQSAVAQARAARQSFLAAGKSVVAQQASLSNLEKKLAAGSANNFDFINAKNSLSISENSLLQSKYDYIFKLKVIDYYLGKPLKL